METFSIKYRLPAKEYVKTMLAGLYRKPGFILATLFGLYYIATSVLDYFHLVHFYSTTPYQEICLGLFLLFSPSIITLISLRQFLSNACFKSDMTYTFSDAGIHVQGLTFKTEFTWQHIIKKKEVRHYLILYQTKNAGHCIDKTMLTAEQLQFIQSKVIKK